MLCAGSYWNFAAIRNGYRAIERVQVLFPQRKFFNKNSVNFHFISNILGSNYVGVYLYSTYPLKIKARINKQH